MEDVVVVSGADEEAVEAVVDALVAPEERLHDGRGVGGGGSQSDPSSSHAGDDVVGHHDSAACDREDVQELGDPDRSGPGRGAAIVTIAPSTGKFVCGRKRLR
jgi:hypothetical protein